MSNFVSFWQHQTLSATIYTTGTYFSTPCRDTRSVSGPTDEASFWTLFRRTFQHKSGHSSTYYVKNWNVWPCLKRCIFRAELICGLILANVREKWRANFPQCFIWWIILQFNFRACAKIKLFTVTLIYTHHEIPSQYANIKFAIAAIRNFP